MGFTSIWTMMTHNNKRANPAADNKEVTVEFQGAPSEEPVLREQENLPPINNNDASSKNASKLIAEVNAANNSGDPTEMKPLKGEFYGTDFNFLYSEEM